MTANSFCRLALCAAFAVSLPLPLPAQSGGHQLFGDLRVDEKAVSGPKPQAYTVILFTVAGRPLGRLQIPNGGRYRFFDVSNGEYNLVVEVEGREVARMNFLIDEIRKTEIRRDIELEWKSDSPGAGRQTGGSPSPRYARQEVNQAPFSLAQELLAKHEFRAAIPLLQQVVQADPGDFEAWNDLGMAQSEDKKQKDAEGSYLKALSVSPDFLLARLNLGKLYLSKQDAEKAIEVLGKAVESAPGSADANFYLGEAYLQVKKGSKAVSYLNEALRIDPVGKAEAHLRLAALYNAAGLKDRAVAETEQFLAKVPDYKDRKKLEQFVRDNKR